MVDVCLQTSGGAGYHGLADRSGRRIAWRPMSNPPHARRFRAVRARQALYDTIRAYLRGEGFDEVETPLLVPCPSMEPHINAFETRFEPEMGAPAGERPLWLHSSP